MQWGSSGSYLHTWKAERVGLTKNRWIDRATFVTSIRPTTVVPLRCGMCPLPYNIFIYICICVRLCTSICLPVYQSRAHLRTPAWLRNQNINQPDRSAAERTAKSSAIVNTAESRRTWSVFSQTAYRSDQSERLEALASCGQSSKSIPRAMRTHSWAMV